MSYDDVYYFKNLLNEPITYYSSHMISKLKLCVKEYRICIDDSKLGDNELVNSCFNTNNLSLDNDKVAMMGDTKKGERGEEGDASCEVSEDSKGEEMTNHGLDKPIPPTLLPSKLVFKSLPNNLKYAFLGYGKTR